MRIWGIITSMAESPAPATMQRPAVLLAMLALCLLGAWPFLTAIDLPPMGLDSVFWMTRGAPDNPDWTQWVFWKQHFNVGYRPVAGLSFTITHAFAGLNPLAYRSTDLAVHLLNGWLVFAVARRLQPAASPWAACLAAAIFWLHPGAEEIVAWIERRSYSIATCLSLLGVWSALGAARAADARPFARRVAVAALAFALSLVSNEMAVLCIAALPGLVFVSADARAGRLRTTLRVVLPVLAAVALTLALRIWVVGEVGGYSPRGNEEERVGLVFAAYWTQLFSFCIDYPIRACSRHPAALALLAGGLLYVTWRALEPLIQRPIHPSQLVPAVLVTWIVGASGVLALQRVWFPREVYPLIPPLALLIGSVVGGTLQSFGAAGGAGRGRLALHLAPQLALVFVLLGDTHVVRGLDPIRSADWREMRAMFEDIERRAREIQEPALVMLAIPYNQDATRINPLKARPNRLGPPRSTRLTTNWMQQRLRDSDVEFLHALSYPEGFDWSSEVRFEEPGGRPALVFPASKKFSVRKDWGNVGRTEGGENAVWLDGFPRPAGQARYLYLRTAGRGEMIPLSRKPS